jgi:hypothetical protein
MPSDSPNALAPHENVDVDLTNLTKLSLFPQANRNHGPSNYQPKYTRGEIRNGLPDNRRQLYSVLRELIPWLIPFGSL